MRLKVKVVRITGSGHGVSPATATRFARERAAVVINCAGEPEPAQQTLAEVEGFGAHALTIRADVAGLPTFLASAEPDYVTGTTDVIDGGLTWNYEEQ